MKCEPLRVDKLKQPSVVLGTKAFQQSQKERLLMIYGPTHGYPPCVLLQPCQHVQTLVARTMTKPLKKAAVPIG